MSLVWQEVEDEIQQLWRKYKDNEMSKIHPEALSKFISEELKSEIKEGKLKQGDLKVFNVCIAPDKPEILWIDYEIEKVNSQNLTEALSVSNENGYEIHKMEIAGEIMVGDSNNSLKISYHPDLEGQMKEVMWFQAYSKSSAEIIEKIIRKFGRQV